MIFHVNLVLYFEYSKILILEIRDWFGLLKISYLFGNFFSTQCSHKLVFLRNEESPLGTRQRLTILITEFLAKISPLSK
ncbi:hypothetical protein IW20_00895 [Flavobacterium hydatis]|uniref:Uncharacterized protein n=1 Tax=Flavobacterium hydatis TaxID=991 RepID=A0A086AUI4_FLAHY|nr:hypothetical protein IW20_00895 [Flavobacterium hydatis]